MIPQFTAGLARLKQYRVLYLFLSVGLVWFLVYRYVPMLGNLIAFKEFSLSKGIFDSRWANPWYKHFETFFSSPYFVQLLTNTLYISLGKMVFSLSVSILFAILLSEIRNPSYKKIVQTLIYLPYFLSWILIYAICYALLTPNGGLLATWLSQTLGIQTDLLADPGFFPSLIFATDVWQGAGYGAIIFMAAIVGVDPQLHEAAKIDGANRFQRIQHIILPAIATVFVFVLMTRLGRVLDGGFDHIFNFYNVRVLNTGDIIDTWVYRVGLEDLRFSLATAVGLFKGVIGFVLVLICNQVARRFGRGLW